MPVACHLRDFRPCAQDSFDAYGPTLLGHRYPAFVGAATLVADGAHGSALRVGPGAYLRDVFYPTTSPALQSRYGQLTNLHRTYETVLCSVWVRLPAAADTGFTLIRWWGTPARTPDPPTPICRLDVAGGGLTFVGGETLATGPGVLPLDRWVQVQFRIVNSLFGVGEDQLPTTLAVRVGAPDLGYATVLGQDLEDPVDHWETLLVRDPACPPGISVAGVDVGRIDDGSAGPEALLDLDDYCAGTMDYRFENAQGFPTALPITWKDGLLVESCPLVAPTLQAPLEAVPPGGGAYAVDGAPTAFEAVDDAPAHDGDASRVRTPDGPAADGFAHAPIHVLNPVGDDLVLGLSAPVFWAREADSGGELLFWTQVAGGENTLDQTGEDGDTYQRLSPPPAYPTYGCSCPLWWGPQAPNPAPGFGDDTGHVGGGTWYFLRPEVDAADVFVQADTGAYVTSVAVEVSHCLPYLAPDPLPPPGGAGARTWVLWWP